MVMAETEKHLTIIPAKTDADLANMHRTKLLEALSTILPMLDAAKKDGFEITFGMGPDFMGRMVIAQFKIAKNF